MPVGLASNASAACTKLDEEIQKTTACKIAFKTDGGAAGGNKEQGRGLRIQYLGFYRRNVFYLPFLYPEEAIWNEDTARKLFEAVFGPNAEQRWETVTAMPTVKEKFAKFAETVASLQGSLTIQAVHGVFLTAWINKKETAYQQTVELLNRIKNTNAI